MCGRHPQDESGCIDHHRSAPAEEDTMWNNDLTALQAELSYRREQIIRSRGAGNIRRRPIRGHRGLKNGYRST
jgi:hypothetical protein